MVRASVLFVVIAFASVNSFTQSAWRVADSMLFDRHKHSAVWIGKSNVLIMGGYVGASHGQFSGTITSTCEMLDVNTGRITSATPMPYARAEFPVLFDKDSNVIVIGGVSSDEGMRSVDRYRRSTGTWEVVGTLRVGRRQHTAQWITDTTILVVGGRNKDVSTIGTCEIFNTKTGTSTATKNYPIIANSLVSFKDKKNQVYVLGGRSGGENSERLPFIFTYNPADSFWKESEYLNISVVAPGISDLSLGRGSIISGGAAAEAPFTTSKGVWWWTGSNLIAFSKLNIGRQWHGSAQFDRERVIVGGGYVEGVNVTATCEWVNIESGYVYAAPPLHAARSYVTFVSVPVAFLPDGRPDRFVVVAIGGVDMKNGCRLVEILGGGSNVDCDPTRNRIVLDASNTKPVGAAYFDNQCELTDGTSMYAGGIWLKNQFNALSPFAINYTIEFVSSGSSSDTLSSDAGYGIVITDNENLLIGKDDIGYGYDGLTNGLAIEVRAYGNEHEDVDPRISMKPSIGSRLSTRNPIAGHSFVTPTSPVMLSNTPYYGRITFDGQTLYSYLSTTPGSSGPNLVVQYTDSQLGQCLNWSQLARVGFTSNGLPGLKTVIRHCDVSSCSITTLPSSVDFTPGNETRYRNEMNIHPQPASSMCMIELPPGSSENAERSIYIHNAQGEVVQILPQGTSATRQLDVSMLPNGLYAVSLMNGSMVVRSTIVVVH